MSFIGFKLVVWAAFTAKNQTVKINTNFIGFRCVQIYLNFSILVKLLQFNKVLITFNYFSRF